MKSQAIRTEDTPDSPASMKVPFQVSLSLLLANGNGNINNLPFDVPHTNISVRATSSTATLSSFNGMIHIQNIGEPPS